MAISAFKILTLQTGMSESELAVLLNRPISAIRDYNRGKGILPDDAFAKLLEIIDHIETWSEKMTRIIQDGFEKNPHLFDLPKIEIGISSDDYEAQAQGFITRSAENMAVSKVLACLPVTILEKIVFVPRGSTPTLAKAEEIRLKNPKNNPSMQ